MFHDREDAALQLAAALRGRSLTRPLVLGVPRGGVIVGATLARALGAELDVVLSRKLRAPHQPELAVGAIAEDGSVFLNPDFADEPGLEEYLARERREQLAEIRRRAALIRAARPPAEMAARSVIVTDDGIATGSTIIAALRTIRARGPAEVIVAVPVAAPDRLREVREYCDEVVCLDTPERFHAIGEFYEDFGQVEDAQMLRALAAADRGLTK